MSDGPDPVGIDRLFGGLDRLAPGTTDDIAWILQETCLPNGARIADAGCGTGCDIRTFHAMRPDLHIVGYELNERFAHEAAVSFSDQPPIDVYHKDMSDLDGEFNLIYSAGAVYFLGISQALNLWRGNLAPGGMIAFSELCWLGPERPPAAADFWAAFPAMTDLRGIGAHIRDAGFRQVASRVLTPEAWRAYYDPLAARAAQLRADIAPQTSAFLDEIDAEIGLWRRHGDAYGYALNIVAPV